MVGKRKTIQTTVLICRQVSRNQVWRPWWLISKLPRQTDLVALLSSSAQVHLLSYFSSSLCLVGYIWLARRWYTHILTHIAHHTTFRKIRNLPSLPSLHFCTLLFLHFPQSLHRSRAPLCTLSRLLRCEGRGHVNRQCTTSLPFPSPSLPLPMRTRQPFAPHAANVHFRTAQSVNPPPY